MTAFDEFAREGRLGPEGAALLYRTVNVVARRRNFPPPADYESWTIDAVREEAHDFLSGPRGLERITALFVQATDQPSFQRLLQTAVRNHLASKARRTVVGRLMRRLRVVLGEDARFVQERARSWSLADRAAPAPVSVSDTDLLDAVWSVPDVRIVRWRPDAKRQSAGADRATLARLAVAVLEAAGGELDEADLARVLANRLGLAELPATAPLDSEDGTTVAISNDTGPATAVALELWDELTERERLAVGVLDQSVRKAAPQLGLGPSRAAEVMNACKEHLRVADIAIDDQDEVFRQLRALSDAHRQATS